MTRAIITIVRHNGEYLYSYSAPRCRGESRFRAGNDPGAAAAKAMEIAIRHGRNGYVIFAPADVMSQIPSGMREKS